MIKKSLVYIFLIVLIYNILLISCQEDKLSVSTPSDFVLNDLKTFKHPLIQCTADTDCPFGSKCVSNYCKYGEFLCSSNNNDKCLYLNSEIYDPVNEVLKVQYRQSPLIEMKPILMSCNMDYFNKNICKTNYCREHNDCISKTCQNGVCIADYNPVYLCQGKNDNSSMEFYCGKQQQMKCENDNECFDGKCESEVCVKFTKDPNSNHFGETMKWKKKFLIVIYILIILIIIVCALNLFGSLILACSWCCHWKWEKNDYENNKMNIKRMDEIMHGNYKY